MKHCQIEQALPAGSVQEGMSLPERILQRGDLALVGVGSLSCIRALYRQAAVCGKLHQLYTCCVSQAKYATGAAPEILRRTTEAALRHPGTAGVILYASCLEVLTAFDFDSWRETLKNPLQLPVEILYRGPMVKRRRKPAEDLQRILEKIPDSGQEMEKGRLALPPIYPDFAAIADILPKQSTCRVILTAGGCTGCMKGHTDDTLKKTRFDDIQASKGCENAVAQEVLQELEEEKDKKLCCLMGSAVPGALGFDYEWVTAQQKGKDIPVVYLPSDGFHSGAEGIGRAYETLGKRFITRTSGTENTVGILGAHLLHTVQKEKIRDGVSCLEKLGCRIVFLEEALWTQGAEIGKVKWNWVVTPEGLPLAQWMEKVHQVPYLFGLPFGSTAERCWLEAAERLQKNQTVQKPEKAADSEPRIAKEGRRVLFIGDPAVSAAIGAYLREEKGCAEIRRAVYAPLVSMRSWYRDVLSRAVPHTPEAFKEEMKEELVFFENTEQLSELVQQAELVLGDAWYQRVIFRGEQEKAWITLPDPMLHTGLQKQAGDYELFGTRGAQWLEKQWNDCFL